MNIATYRDFCLAKPGITESFSFDEETIVFKLMGKIFTLACIVPFERLNVKCDPSGAIALRQRYASVVPGYHMNKKTLEYDLCEWRASRCANFWLDSGCL